MNKGIVGFLVGLIAVLGGAFVATVLLKNKLTKKDEDDFDDFDDYDDVIDDEEFVHFFGEDDEEMPVVDEDEAEADEEDEEEEEQDGEKEEQL